MGATGTVEVEQGCEGGVVIGGTQLIKLTARLPFNTEIVQHITVVDLELSRFKTRGGARGTPGFNTIATAAEPRRGSAMGPRGAIPDVTTLFMEGMLWILGALVCKYVVWLFREQGDG